jgi:hypothetical protein
MPCFMATDLFFLLQRSGFVKRKPESYWLASQIEHKLLFLVAGGNSYIQVFLAACRSGGVLWLYKLQKLTAHSAGRLPKSSNAYDATPDIMNFFL